MAARNSEIAGIRAELARSGVTQARLARLAGCHPSHLNRVLRGHCPPSAGFLDSLRRTIDLCARAEEAAEEARERVLAAAAREAREGNDVT